MPTRKKILVIDDDAVRDMLGLYLRGEGFEVAVAAGGEQGIALMRSMRPDAVLCDLRMPNVDGLAVLEVAVGEFPSMPIVVMSGAGVLSDAVNALKLGAWDYVMKPFAELVVVRHALDRALRAAELQNENRAYREHLEHLNQELIASLRMLKEDEEAGRQIQFRLLPENDQVLGGYRISRDLMTSTHMSGDFIDTFSIDDGHVGFYLADVAGHGVSSAFVTLFLKNFMQHQCEQHGETGCDVILSPARTLDRLNHDMLRERLGKHLTIFYGVIDTETDELTYSSGGQYPWPILFDGKQTRCIECRSMPVGLFEFAHFEEQHLRLPERFVLALCSDGVLELMPKSLEEKTASLCRMVSDFDVTVESLHNALAPEKCQPLPDDVTLLMLKREESNDPQRSRAVR